MPNVKYENFHTPSLDENLPLNKTEITSKININLHQNPILINFVSNANNN